MLFKILLILVPTFKIFYCVGVFVICGMQSCLMLKNNRKTTTLAVRFGCLVSFFIICSLGYYLLWNHLYVYELEVNHLSAKMTKSNQPDSSTSHRQQINDENLSDTGKFLRYIALSVSLQYEVLGNYKENANMHVVTLKNNGEKAVPEGQSIPWSLYFNDLHLPEYDSLQYARSVELGFGDFRLTHVDGGLFQLSPTASFQGIKPQEDLQIIFQSYTTVSRDYILPRWYVAAGPSEEPWIMNSTDGNSPKFVTEFNKVEQWKRGPADYYDPFTLEKRFAENRFRPTGHLQSLSYRIYLNKTEDVYWAKIDFLNKYFVPDDEEAPLRVIPTPLFSDLNKDKLVHLNPLKWAICPHQVFKLEIQLLSNLFNIPILSDGEPCRPTHIINFSHEIVPGVPESKEAYRIEINADSNIISICAQDKPGAFYAIQTLNSLAEFHFDKSKRTVPSGVIQDSPRFKYRGLHIDVARNFIPLDDILLIIESMSMYKLNKLHFHLTDDEGWRVEIEGLPELTDIGAVRRHCFKEDKSLFPALGSGPFDDTSGTGFYSVSDYQKILEVAEANHVQVIPEVDVPGHSHAAIRAMQARYRRLKKEGKEQEANEFLVSDPNDRSSAMSVQHFRNNAINPCMDSTYKFMSHVIGALKKMHQPIQPLKVIHVGGDEVARDSWAGSPICMDLLESNDTFPYGPEDLQEYFMRRVAKICKEEFKLTMAVWEDGALRSDNNEPYNKTSLHNCDVMTYAWNNNWRRQTAARAHKLANAGYKVIMAHATHLYFDHPQEPDPEEKGLTWATRYIDDKKVFDYRPEDLFGNAKADSNGAIFTDEEMDDIRLSNPVLDEPQNIIGMQANIWSEMLRDASMVHSQLFPRLIAFAERAWHKATWEEDSSEETITSRLSDWSEFANVVGYKELPRLKRMGINYRIPPPGVNIIDDKFQLCSMYPGFKVFYRPMSDQQSSDWTEVKSGDPIPDRNTKYEFVCSDGDRLSRIVK